uniref:UCH domain-containing protein n=1 Tax=Macrostomum lignano TaxID=282301 RepID=A0A1I8GYN2_9PLAT
PSETFADPESVACLSDSNAAHSGTYSVKCSSELASSIAETVHSSKNVAVSEDYKTQTYREQAVAEVQAIGFSPVLLFFDTISGQQLKFSDCLDMGLIDLNNSCLVDPVTRIELPLLDALERNVVDRESDKDFTVVDSDAVEQPEISREEQDSEQLSAEKAAANSSDSAAEDFGKSEESGIVKTSEEQSEASQRQQLVLESGLTRLDQDESSQATKDAHKESSNAGDSISIASSTEITDSNKKDDSELFGRPNIKDSENREVDELDEPKFSFRSDKDTTLDAMQSVHEDKTGVPEAAADSSGAKKLDNRNSNQTSPSASDGDAGVSISKDTDTKGGSLDTDDRAYSQTVRRMSAASMEQNSLSSLAIQHLSHASHEFHGQKLDPGQFPVGFSTQPIKHHEVSPTEAEAAESRPSEERQEQLNPEAKELELRADKESREAPKPEEAVKQAEVRDEVAPTDAQAAESR